MECKDCGKELTAIKTTKDYVKYRCFNCGKHEIINKKKSLKEKVRGWFGVT